MVAVFDFTDFRKYLIAWIDEHGERGYGLKGRLAEAMRVSSSLVSQILKGEKALTPDQASDLCDFIGLNDIESEYLHLLVDLDRAGNPKFREKLKRKILHLQEQSKKIGKRVPRHKELTDEQKAIYYSSWLYTGIRNLTAVSGFQSPASIAEHLKLEPAVVHRVIHFLIENGLCKEVPGGVTYGPASLHVDKDSPFVNKHHQNWRFQSIQKMERRLDEDLFFTGPMSLSVAASDEIRSLLPNFIQSVMKIAGPSDSETTACLNIDWFKY